MIPTFTVESAIKNVCEKLGDFYGLQLKNYGEATESLQADSAGNYISIDGNQFCSVDDSYRLVIFLVRENATTNNQPAGGRRNILTRNVSFKVCVNSKHREDEFALANLLNDISHVTYGGTDYDSKAVALRYFGLPERNFETYFFTLDIEVLEKITCQPC